MPWASRISFSHHLPLQRARFGDALRWRLLITALMAGLLALSGCAQMRSAALPPERFAHDAHFDPAPDGEQAADIFSLSEPMRAYADKHLQQRRPGDPRRTLIDALYGPDALQLRYDDSRTRTAAQAFEERAGNCMSLVLMTAAFAKHLGLPLSYQRVAAQPTYSRKAGMLLVSSHVNLVLQKQLSARLHSRFEDADLTVDFLPGVDVAGLSAELLSESQLLALYRSNRAAERLTEGQISEAYWWARAAVQADPMAAGPRNTLGVVYLRAGLLAAAEESFSLVLQNQADDQLALGNLALVLRKQGRPAEAEAAQRRLARLQPQAPFAAFDAGRRAMQAGDSKTALRLFEQELRQQPTHSELHFWTAQAHHQLGHERRMLAHLRLARDYSASPSDVQRFSDKLASLELQLGLQQTMQLNRTLPAASSP